MTDYFAVLRQPRRPWLDPDELKRQYQKLALERHPDRTSSSSEQDDGFAEIAQAYRVLRDPRLRIQHLLAIQAAGTVTSGSPGISDDLSELFMEAANLIRQIDLHLEKRTRVASTLGSSLLEADTARLQRLAADLVDRLQQTYAATMNDLQAIDKSWTCDPARSFEDIRRLGDRFGFLDRWIAQLREKVFELAS